VCPQKNYSGIWSPSAVLTLTQRRCQLSLKWSRPKAFMMSRSWRGAWLPWATSSHDSVSGDSLCLSSSKRGQIPVDSGATRGFWRLEEVSEYPAHSGGPGTHKNLQLYISVTRHVVSIAIIVERGQSDTNHKIQYLVYFISEVLSDSKTLHTRLRLTPRRL
jgi:hypothetical protein